MNKTLNKRALWCCLCIMDLMLHRLALAHFPLPSSMPHAASLVAFLTHFSYFLHLGQWKLWNLPQSSQGARKEKSLRTPTEKKLGWFSVHVYVSLCEKQNTNTQTHKGWTGIACPLHLPVTLTVPLVLFSTCQVEESANAAMAFDITLCMPQDVNW